MRTSPYAKFPFDMHLEEHFLRRRMTRENEDEREGAQHLVPEHALVPGLAGEPVREQQSVMRDRAWGISRTISWLRDVACGWPPSGGLSLGRGSALRSRRRRLGQIRLQVF
jgi:hypothetical protein